MTISLFHVSSPRCGSVVLYSLGCAFGPLAFTANVNARTVVRGILATFIFTIPVAFLEYTPKQTKTTPEITEKTQALWIG